MRGFDDYGSKVSITCGVTTQRLSELLMTKFLVSESVEPQ